MKHWLQLLFVWLAVTAQASLPHAVKTIGSIRSYGYDEGEGWCMESASRTLPDT